MLIRSRFNTTTEKVCRSLLRKLRTENNKQNDVSRERYLRNHISMLIEISTSVKIFNRKLNYESLDFHGEIIWIILGSSDILSKMNRKQTLNNLLESTCNWKVFSLNQEWLPRVSWGSTLDIRREHSEKAQDVHSWRKKFLRGGKEFA